MIEAQQLYQMWTTLHDHQDHDERGELAPQFEKLVLKIAQDKKLDEAVGEILNHPHTFDLSGGDEQHPQSVQFYEDIVRALTARAYIASAPNEAPLVNTCEIFAIPCYGDRSLIVDLHKNTQLQDMLAIVMPEGVKGYLMGAIPVERGASLLMSPQVIYQAMSALPITLVDDAKAIKEGLHEAAAIISMMEPDFSADSSKKMVLGGFLIMGVAIGKQPLEHLSFLQGDTLTEEAMDQWNEALSEWAEQHVPPEINQVLTIGGPEALREAVVEGLTEYVVTSLTIQHQLSDTLTQEMKRVDVVLQDKDLTPEDKISIYCYNTDEDITGSVELHAMTSALLIPDLLAGIEYMLPEGTLSVSVDTPTHKPKTLH